MPPTAAVRTPSPRTHTSTSCARHAGHAGHAGRRPQAAATRLMPNQHPARRESVSARAVCRRADHPRAGC